MKNYFKELGDVEHVANYLAYRYYPEWKEELEHEISVYVGRIPWTRKWVVFEHLEGIRNRRSGIYSSRERAIQRARLVAQLEDGRNL
jgi:hypothetical protein